MRHAKDKFQDLLANAIDTDSHIEPYRIGTREIGLRLVPKPMDPIQRMKVAIRHLAAKGVHAPSDPRIATLANAFANDGGAAAS
jgi:hypothetical protein